MNNDLQTLENEIEKIWANREEISAETSGNARNIIEKCLGLLDSGDVRVSQKVGENWIVNEWLKKVVLLSFKLWPMDTITGGPGNSNWWDKVPSKFSKWTNKNFIDSNNVLVGLI